MCSGRSTATFFSGNRKDPSASNRALYDSSSYVGAALSAAGVFRQGSGGSSLLCQEMMKVSHRLSTIGPSR